MLRDVLVVYGDLASRSGSFNGVRMYGSTGRELPIGSLEAQSVLRGLRNGAPAEARRPDRPGWMRFHLDGLCGRSAVTRSSDGYPFGDKPNSFDRPTQTDNRTGQQAEHQAG